MHKHWSCPAGTPGARTERSTAGGRKTGEEEKRTGQIDLKREREREREGREAERWRRGTGSRELRPLD